MKKFIKSKWNLKTNFNGDSEYKNCILELINNSNVRSMEKFIQHSDLSCLEHSINVSYNSYLICKFLKLDYKAAARGGMLHDMFLYDWHISDSNRGLHGFTHPSTALKNANKYFKLNDMEKDIIQKHMWPLTLRLPKYKEAFIVSFVDKYCAFMEVVSDNSKNKIYRIEEYISRI